MPIEQRVISPQKIGARGAGPGLGAVKAGAAAAEPEKPKRSRKRLFIVLAAVLLVLVGGSGYYFFLGPGSGGSHVAAAPPAPKPGAVLTVAPKSHNLADGHYLRIGLGLQLTVDVAKAPDPAKALDLVIALFSGHTIAEVSTPATRDSLKAQLKTELAKAYDGEVMDVYLTTYVTQ
jgi:flagellar FliL protein